MNLLSISYNAFISFILQALTWVSTACSLQCRRTGIAKWFLFNQSNNFSVKPGAKNVKYDVKPNLQLPSLQGHDGSEGSVWHKFGHQPMSARTVCVQPKSYDCGDCPRWPWTCENTSIYADTKCRLNRIVYMSIFGLYPSLKTKSSQQWSHLVQRSQSCFYLFIFFSHMTHWCTFSMWIYYWNGRLLFICAAPCFIW